MFSIVFSVSLSFSLFDQEPVPVHPFPLLVLARDVNAEAVFGLVHCLTGGARVLRAVVKVGVSQVLENVVGLKNLAAHSAEGAGLHGHGVRMQKLSIRHDDPALWKRGEKKEKAGSQRSQQHGVVAQQFLKTLRLLFFFLSHCPVFLPRYLARRLIIPER